MKRVRVNYLVLLVLAAVILFSGVPAQAAEKSIELRLAHQYPVGSPLHQHIDMWSKRIAADSNGKLTVRIFPVNTLVPPPELYNSAVNGTADIAFGSRYNPKGYTLGVTFPFILGAPDMATADKVYDDIWKKFPKVMAEEWRDVKVLWLGPATPQAVITKKAIRTLEDMKGLQIRSGSKEGGDLLKDLGATPVFMPSGDLVMGLEKGTIDGAVIQSSAVKDFKLAGKIKYVLDVSLGVPMPIMGIMNRDSYDKLPADLKAVVDKNCAFGKQGVLDAWIELLEDDNKYFKTEGIQVIHLSPQERARWTPIIERARDRVGADLDAKGYPGTEIVRFIRERVAHYTR
jgi:TRAP-type transport system periplasmic protein